MTMRKLLLFSIMLMPLGMCAQTYYYKLQKITHNDNVSTNVNGGQFVSFANKKKTCFESDYEGFSVGHGRLEFDEHENGWDVYYGASYWGDRTFFLFNSDKSSLKVKTEEGFIYEYYRQLPPKGITTCSLIRSVKESKETNGVIYVPIPQIEERGVFNKDNPISIERKKMTQPVQHVCSVCHGEKTIVKDMNPPSFGTLDVKKYCNRCNKYFFQSTGHSHITCPECHGKGYWISK